jgi:hydrogenase nickel incorporation protein HypB
MFRAADLVLITKSDLLEVLGDFDPEAAESYLRQIANPAPLFDVSAKTGTGMSSWLDWIQREAGKRR